MSRRLLAAAAAAVLACAGIGTAIAAGTVTTGTVSVCATATTPDHTVDVDGTPVATVPSDAASQCATTTYTVPTDTVTVTVTGTTTATTTTTSPGSPTFESETTYTQTRPSFTAKRQVDVASAAALKSAITNLQPGDLVKATSAFTVSGETVISRRLAGRAELDLQGVSFVYSGGSNIPAVYLNDASNLYIYGGDLSTADTGGQCLLFHGSQQILWWGFKVHDCGSSGVSVLTAGAAVNHLDLAGEITRIGQNLARDPHTEKGTGLHGAIMWDANTSYSFTNNRFAFYAHDIPTGACVEVGNDQPASNAVGNVLYLKCVNETEVSKSQTGGNALQTWGDTDSLGLDVKYLEGDNLEGAALFAWGTYSGQTDKGITVEYGRASDTNQNPEVDAKQPTPWDTSHGIVYGDVQPTP